MARKPIRARDADDTESALHYDPPEVIDLRQVLGQCAVFDCSGETVALRWEREYLGEYLPVCKVHRGAP